MNYSEIKYNDIANGVGVRTSLFVSGCRHHCPGCFNDVAWEFDSGMPYTNAVEGMIVRSLMPSHVSGLSILGGEPLEPENQPDVAGLIQHVRMMVPEATIWMWTGFTYENLMHGRSRTEVLPYILKNIDVLVDERYVKELADITLRFRGSSNQRIIDVPKTLESGEVCLWDDGHVRGRM